MATSHKKSAAPQVDQTRAVELASTLLSRAEQEPEGAVRELETLAGGDPVLALASVAALGRVHNPQAARALLAISESVLGKDLRKEARRGLHRLHASGVGFPQADAPRPRAGVLPRQRGTLYDTWATAPDRSGTRVLWLLADRPLGGIDAVGLIVNDLVGLREARFRDTTKKRFEADLERWRQDSTAGWVRLPPDYAAQLVGEALALNERSKQPVPHEFQINQKRVEGLTRPFESALVYREVSLGAARLAPNWLRESPALLDEPELEDWVFPPEAVRPFARRMGEARGGTLLVTSQARPERQEQILTQAIERVITPDVRQALKRRLEEVGYMFLRTERPQQARRAVGAAAGIEDASASRLLIQQSVLRLEQHPFLRAMMRRSLASEE